MKQNILCKVKRVPFFGVSSLISVLDHEFGVKSQLLSSFRTLHASYEVEGPRGRSSLLFKHSYKSFDRGALLSLCYLLYGLQAVRSSGPYLLRGNASASVLMC